MVQIKIQHGGLSKKIEVADPESLPNKSSKNENCEKNPLPIRKSKKLLERKEDKEAKS